MDTENEKIEKLSHESEVKGEFGYNSNQKSRSCHLVVHVTIILEWAKFEIYLFIINPNKLFGKSMLKENWHTQSSILCQQIPQTRLPLGEYFARLYIVFSWYH